MNGGMEMVKLVKSCCCTLVVLLCVALMWEPCGDHAFYHLMLNRGFTRHAAGSRMPRVDERNSQVIGCLAAEGEAGILQRDVGVRGG